MMQTRCPACGTSFRITAEQLKIRQGQVRCGRCQQIFNALETLMDRPSGASADLLGPGGEGRGATVASELPQAATDVVAAAATPETLATATPQDDMGAQAGLGEPLADSDGQALPAAADEFGLDDLDLDLALQKVAQELVPGAAGDFSGGLPQTTQATPQATPQAAEPEAGETNAGHSRDHVFAGTTPEPGGGAPVRVAAQSPRVAPNIDAALSYVASTTEAAMPQDLPFEAYEKARRQGRRGWLWYGLGMFLLLLLLLQMAVHFRVELGVLIPGSRPGFARLCEFMGCELPLPHKPDLLSISSSDLHPQAGAPGQFRLLASLRNRAPFAQEYPHLELTLTDIVDQPLVRKVIAPEDYLAAGIERRQGFAAGADLSLQLALKVDARTHAAAGYRLYVFYP